MKTRVVARKDGAGTIRKQETNPQPAFSKRQIDNGREEKAACLLMPGSNKPKALNPEALRLVEGKAGRKPWKLWGPYLSERQWGTVREDYSANGEAWEYFPHDHARSRAYRWGEDGLAGISDSGQRLCLALALWNGRDPILKERMFGLTNPRLRGVE